LHYGPADAPATPPSLASLKSRLVETFWFQLTEVVLEKESIKRVCVFLSSELAGCYQLETPSGSMPTVPCGHPVFVSVYQV